MFLSAKVRLENKIEIMDKHIQLLFEQLDAGLKMWMLPALWLDCL